MAKVSKNLKKVRTEKGLTQDALAEKLSVTRQTISSWENDRTQPDIEMLKTLAEVLGIDIEVLLYGEKRHVGLEPDKNRSNRSIIVVLSVLGSMLLGVGLILIFVVLWKRFPLALKTVFALLPMLAGEVTALLVYLKKNDSRSWREGAAAIWIVGLCASVGLVIGLYDFSLSWSGRLLLISLMLLPIIYLLDSVFSLTVYYVLISVRLFVDYSNDWLDLVPDGIIILITFTLLFALGFLYVILNRKKSDCAAYKYAVWLSVITASASIFVIFSILTEDYISVLVSYFSAVFACFIAMYAANREGESPYRFKYLGAPGIALVLIIICGIITLVLPYDYYDFIEYDSGVIIGLLLQLAVVGLGIAFGKKEFSKNPEKIIITSCSFASLVLCWVFDSIGEYVFLFTLLFIALTLAVGITLIVSGIKSAKLSTTNLGLITVSFVAAFLIFSGQLGLLWNGIACVLIGTALLITNFKLQKSFKLKSEIPEKEAGYVA